MFARAVVAAAILAGVGANCALAGDGPDGDLRSGPTLNGDWFGDDIEFAGAPSNGGPYDFTLVQPAYFRITDAFVIGDQFTATDLTTGLLGVTSLAGARPATTFGVDPIGEPAWRSGNFQTLEAVLAPGSYSITVTGNGAGGLPAGFYVQLETVVPSPAGAMVIGLAGLAAARRRR